MQRPPSRLAGITVTRLGAAAALAAVLSLAPGPARAFDLKHRLWNRTLKAHVREGLVDYGRLKAEPGALEDYLRELASASEGASWTTEDKIAFWINAYNALTLKAVIDHYPIRPRLLASVRYPKNSIRQIPGVWDRLEFTVQGSCVTLDEIEHQVLRKRFAEPRIHMALVCAAKGCPPLRYEAYTGPALADQLDDQTYRLLRDPAKFRVDHGQKRVRLSPIFKWFGEDFVPGYGGGELFPGRKPSERAALYFAFRHIDPVDRAFLKRGDFVVEYLSYDWSLNERAP